MAPLTEISRVFGQQSPTEPISRTLQYRKITKPLLERQRRARINRCLDELKEILVTGLQSEGENVARLEKADILELTVRHLHKLQQQQRLSPSVSPSSSPSVVVENPGDSEVSTKRPPGDDEKFRAGYAKCAQEVSRALAQSPTIDLQVGTALMVHLGHALNQISSCGQGQPSSLSESSRTPGTYYSSPSPYRPETPPSSPQETIPCYIFQQPWRPW